MLILILQKESNGHPFTESVIYWVSHHDETLEHIKLMLDSLKSQGDLPIDLSLVNQLLAFHGLFEHLVRQLLTHEPARTVVVLVLHFTSAYLGWHLLQTSDHSQIIGIDIALEVVKTTKFFAPHWALCSQVFYTDASPIQLASQIVHYIKRQMIC